ncbi:MAG: peptide deformylase [bacterium]|nr:peptide deformylase [bacterium]MDT8365820.1 peptide deformylase [bacterium]
MPLLSIRTYPDPVLRRECKPAEPGGAELNKLAEDMLETMYAAPGVGLAAPQVGVSLKMIVVDVGVALGEKDPIVFLNPEIVNSSEVIAFEEGCLSLPEFTVEVERARVLEVKYQDLEGKEKTLTAEDFLSVAIQHEMDHLEGRLLLDHTSAIRRQIYHRQARKMKAQIS